MRFTGKTVAIFGGSGAIGAAVGRAMAAEGAHVWLGARSQDRLEAAAQTIRSAGGLADTFIVDTLDEDSMRAGADRLARAGGVDVVVNTTGFMHDQGKEIGDLSLDEFRRGFDPFLIALFNISKAMAPLMGGERGGTFINLVAPAARMAIPGHLGHIVGCAGIEAFSRALASELGPRNIRVLCLRSHAVADALQAGSYTREVFAPKAQAMGLSVEDWIGGAAHSTMHGRLPTLEQVGRMVAFLASDDASAMTGTAVNLTGGAAID